MNAVEKARLAREAAEKAEKEKTRKAKSDNLAKYEAMWLKYYFHHYHPKSKTLDDFIDEKGGAYMFNPNPPGGPYAIGYVMASLHDARDDLDEHLEEINRGGDEVFEAKYKRMCRAVKMADLDDEIGYLYQLATERDAPLKARVDFVVQVAKIVKNYEKEFEMKLGEDYEDYHAKDAFQMALSLKGSKMSSIMEALSIFYAEGYVQPSGYPDLKKSQKYAKKAEKLRAKGR